MFPLAAPSPKGPPPPHTKHIPSHVLKEILAITAQEKAVYVVTAGQTRTAVGSTAPCPLLLPTHTHSSYVRAVYVCTPVLAGWPTHAVQTNLLVCDIKLANYNFLGSK